MGRLLVTFAMQLLRLGQLLSSRVLLSEARCGIEKLTGSHCELLDFWCSEVHVPRLSGFIAKTVWQHVRFPVSPLNHATQTSPTGVFSKFRAWWNLILPFDQWFSLLLRRRLQLVPRFRRHLANVLHFRGTPRVAKENLNRDFRRQGHVTDPHLWLRGVPPCCFTVVRFARPIKWWLA